MANGNLHIENVDLKLLELQRRALFGLRPGSVLTDEQASAVEGIRNMLDYWSDERYTKHLSLFKEGDDKNINENQTAGR